MGVDACSDANNRAETDDASFFGEHVQETLKATEFIRLSPRLSFAVDFRRSAAWRSLRNLSRLGYGCY